MNIKIIKKIPTPEEIIQKFPLSEKGHAQVAQDRREVGDILSGKDDRLLVILGPCSAWPYSPVLEYGKKIKELSLKVQDKIKLVLRVYIQKPRTTKGWTGPVNQPDPFSLPDIEEGMNYSRSLMVSLIEMGLPIADEALFTHNAKGFIELLSWVAIGARSSEDQEHRIFASGINCPVGMKNGTSGLVEIGINGVIAAQNSHTAVLNGFQVETLGNDFAHLVLRGGLNGPNYDEETLKKVKELMEENNIKNPAVIIDASHDNCRIQGKKDCLRQVDVAKKIISFKKHNPQLGNLVKGIMLESFIKNGNQKVDINNPDNLDRNGLSITDPCLGWEETEKLIKELHQEI